KLKEPRRIPQAWTIGQFSKLVETAYLGEWLAPTMTAGLIEGVPARLWWTGLLLIAYDSGVRIGALLQLRCDDVDLESGRLFVRAETQKQNADQAFTLDPSTATLLKQFADVPRELLFACT